MTTTLVKLLEQKQQLIERLQGDLGPEERDEIDRLMEKIDTALNLRWGGAGKFLTMRFSDVPVFMSNHPAVLAPAATIFAASVAAYIALRLSKGQLAIAKLQTEIARDKLKFDLFEMRYDIYAKVKELIGYTQTIHDYEKIDAMRVRALYVNSTRLFFDARVIEFISKVRQTAETRFHIDHTPTRDWSTMGDYAICRSPAARRSAPLHHGRTDPFAPSDTPVLALDTARSKTEFKKSQIAISLRRLFRNKAWRDANT